MLCFKVHLLGFGILYCHFAYLGGPRFGVRKHSAVAVWVHASVALVREFLDGHVIITNEHT